MNKRNLFFIPLAAMLLAGCNFTAGVATTTSEPAPSTSQADPVSRIKVTAPAADIVVGDVVDLDDYVKVVGGTDAAAYEITVAPSSADVVEFEGHVMTVLKAGAINLDVKSTVNPAVTAVVEWTAYHELVAKFKGATNSLTNVFAFEAGWDTTTGECNKKIVHQEKYCMFPNWEDSGAKQAGGFVVINGTTYAYVATDSFGTDAEALPGPYGEFGNYYVNMPWCVDASVLEVVEDEQNGDYLVLPTTVASNYSTQFGSLIAEFAYCALAMDIESTLAAFQTNYAAYNFVLNPMKIVYDAECEQFGFVLSFGYNTTATYPLGSYYLNNDADFAKVASVEAIIEAGVEPEPVDFSALSGATAAVATAKNYSYEITSGWYTKPNMAKTTSCPADLVTYNYDKYFKVGTETGKVTETALYRETSEGYKGGYVVDGGALYEFDNIDADTNEYTDPTVLTATATTETSLWEGKYSSETLAAFGSDDVWTGFVAQSSEYNEEDAYTEVVFNAGDGIAAFEAMMNATYYGWYVNTILSKGWQSDLRSYVYVYAWIDATSVEVLAYFAWDNATYYCLDAKFNSVGTTTIDVAGLNIVMPQAE